MATHSLFALETTSGVLVQISATSRGLVVDLQATNYGSDGASVRCHATGRLHLDEAMHVEALLGRAITAAWHLDDANERVDPRQTALELAA